MTYLTEQQHHPQLLQCLLGPIPAMLQMIAAFPWNTGVNRSPQYQNFYTTCLLYGTRTLFTAHAEHICCTLPMGNTHTTLSAGNIHSTTWLLEPYTLWTAMGKCRLHCTLSTHALACLLWRFLWNISTALSNYKLSHLKTQHFATLCFPSLSHHTIISLYFHTFPCLHTVCNLWSIRLMSVVHKCFQTYLIYIPPPEWRTAFWVIWWALPV